MRTIATNVYTYAELSDKAKEKARDWYREVYDGESEWDCIQEDAKEIGLRLIGLRPTGIQGNNEGEFITTARECAEKILANHGGAGATYATARAYLKAIGELALDADGEFVDVDRADELTREFRYNLLEDYRKMLEEANEYQNSDEAVEEILEINSYEFTEDGKRARV